MLSNLLHPSSALTLLGLLAALAGMVADLRTALICLVVAGLCDLADGPVARRMRRSAEQQRFGVHLDSLVDVVSFLVLPAVIIWAHRADLGAPTLLLLLVTPLYVIAGVARLASFTADAEPDTRVTHYTGLPVTYAALVLPVLATAWLWFGVDLDQPRTLTTPALAPLGTWWLWAMAALAVLYVAPLRIPKPRGIAHVVFAVLAVVVLVGLATVRP